MRPCTLVGNVGQNPEMRYTPNGTAVTFFSLALYGGKTQETEDHKAQDITTWVRITAWKELAEVVNAKVSKGDKLEVSGYLLPIEVYTKKDGTPGQSIKLTAFAVKALEYSPTDLDHLPDTGE